MYIFIVEYQRRHTNLDGDELSVKEWRTDSYWDNKPMAAQRAWELEQMVMTKRVRIRMRIKNKPGDGK